MRNDIKFELREGDSFMCSRRLEIDKDHPPGEMLARRRGLGICQNLQWLGRYRLDTSRAVTLGNSLLCYSRKKT